MGYEEEEEKIYKRKRERRIDGIGRGRRGKKERGARELRERKRKIDDRKGGEKHREGKWRRAEGKKGKIYTEKRGIRGRGKGRGG